MATAPSTVSSVVLAILTATAFSAESHPYVAGELLVRFARKPDGARPTLNEQNTLLASIGAGTVEHRFKIVPGLTLVKLPPNVSVEQAVPVLNNTEGILHAHPNYLLRIVSTFPDDPNFADQWGLHNTGQTGGTSDADIDGPEAWDLTTDANHIVVAVIDSGVDYNHPDLRDNMWVNQAEKNGQMGERVCLRQGLCLTIPP